MVWNLHIKCALQRAQLYYNNWYSFKETDKSTDPPPDLSKFAYSKSKVIDSCDQSVKTTSLWSPKQWRQQLENIKLMRASRDAPVDKIGASKLAYPFTIPEIRRYQVLISLMLSSQTKDEVTASAMTRLKHHGLDIENINLTPQNDIEELIKPVGFYRNQDTQLFQGYLIGAMKTNPIKYTTQISNEEDTKRSDRMSKESSMNDDLPNLFYQLDIGSGDYMCLDLPDIDELNL